MIVVVAAVIGIGQEVPGTEIRILVALGGHPGVHHGVRDGLSQFMRKHAHETVHGRIIGRHTERKEVE